MKTNRIDLNKIKTVSLSLRPSKVNTKGFAKPLSYPITFHKFWTGLPDILAGKNIRNLVKSIFNARKKDKPIIFMFGAHVIKCGLGPLIIDLIKHKYITALATNGACAIHDFEIAFAGHTSEDVSVRLKDGSFGMTRQTAEFLNKAAKDAALNRLGLGYSIGKKIVESKLKFQHLSVFANAFKMKVPITVHVAIGTDIIYQHPNCDGASWGGASYNDFITFVDNISRIGNGGVVINFGSAVILPEVFLKSLTICRNLGYKVFNFTTANFDMIRQYRPIQNIVIRPTQDNGYGYEFIGHHEIMLPLLYSAIINGES